ncbi:efflux transporter outer membrane subunit [Janthinobacterium sp. PAMC25594]|uniref:efflux transporter outer membrane subunit n=1 Tax=Janthinobacterium sp. PAMC25594 TaxID=2861284 RepID=UPI001C62A0E6|nr:efflux transporter outer membrane subunit [Janthinobacterium sp. PAMC25594]QYG05864.1 efflux transporter outer membrane subunit [Janthinobacterium sp. PAMC25594]
MIMPVPALSACARMAALATALATTLALAGCASMAPPYAPPPLPVAAQYPETDPAGAHAADIAWQAYFADARLQALIAQALASNRDIRIAALRVEEARAAYGIQRAEQFPTIALGASGSRARVPGDLSVTGRPMTSAQYQTGLNVSAWELDFWGRVRSLKDSALQTLLASDEARRAVSVALVAQVANGYLGLRELDERVALARATVDSRAESLRIFTRRFEVGSISKLDLTQVETLLSQALSLSAQLEQARAVQAHALAQLVGGPVDLTPDTRRFDDASVLQPLHAGLPSALLTQRPDLMAAEHQLRAAQANIGAARAAFFPTISLTAAYGTASAELSGLFDSGSGAWSFAPRLVLPIFDAGRIRANMDLAEVRRDVAVANYEKSVQGAFREVADALSNRRWLALQVDIGKTTLAAQSERARLAKLRYDNGAAPYLEVLDAQRDLLTVEQQLVQTRRALLSSQVSLYAALGGGAPAASAAASTH